MSKFTAKWSFANVLEFQATEKWLKESVGGKFTHDLTGVAETPSHGGAPAIGVLYRFENEADCTAFLTQFPGAERIAEPEPAAAGPTATQTPPDEDDGFDDGAKRILDGPPPVSAGKLHLLGLDKVKAHFGDNWQKLAPRVDALVKRTIERRLTPHDVYRRTGDMNYIILFGDLSDQEAEIKCGVMVEEISRMLVGDEMGGGALEVKSLATSVDAALLQAKNLQPAQIVKEIENLVEREQERRAAVEAKAKPAAPETALEKKSEFHFVYRPVWDVRRSVLASFVCVPMRPKPGAGAGMAELTRANIFSENERYELDHAMIERVTADLEIMRRNGRRLAVCVPLNYENVSVISRRRTLFEIWSRVPAEYKKASILEVMGVPEGVPQSRVAEMVSALKSNFGAVFVRLPLEFRSMSNLSETGVVAIGVEASFPGATEERLMRNLEGFAQAADKNRMLAYVRGLQNFGITLSAVASGFAFIDGDAISGAIDRPSNAFRMNIDDLYSGMLRKKK